MELMRDGMFVPAELTNEMLDIINGDNNRSVLVLFSFEMLPVLQERGYKDVTLYYPNPKKYLRNFVDKYGYEIIGDLETMDFDITLGNPPFSEIAEGVEGAKITKQNPIYHQFFAKAADCSDVVAMICPKTDYAKRGFIVRYNNLINKHAQVIKDCSEHFNVRVETNYIIWEKGKDPKDQVPTMQNIQEDNPLPEFKRGDHYMRFTSSNHPGIYDKKKNKNCRRVIATINKKDGVVYNWADVEVVKGKTFSAPYLVVMACCLQHGGHFHNAQVIETNGERMFADVNIAVWEFTSKRAANKLKKWLNSDEFRDIQLSLPWFRGRTSDLRMLPNVG
jgi:hypothetical protein